MGRACGVRDESVTHRSPWKAYAVGEPEPQSLDKAHPWQGLSAWSGHSETEGREKGEVPQVIFSFLESYFHFLLSISLAFLGSPSITPSASWAHLRHFCSLRPGDPWLGQCLTHGTSPALCSKPWVFAECKCGQLRAVGLQQTSVQPSSGLKFLNRTGVLGRVCWWMFLGCS